MPGRGGTCAHGALKLRGFTERWGKNRCLHRRVSFFRVSPLSASPVSLVLGLDVELTASGGDGLGGGDCGSGSTASTSISPIRLLGELLRHRSQFGPFPRQS